MLVRTAPVCDTRSPVQLIPKRPARPKTANRAQEEHGSIAQQRQVESHNLQIIAISPKTMVRSILPDRFRSVLKYTETLQFSSSTGGIVGSTNTFRLNGLYDPNTTGVGHQPYGFDQITPFYSAYTVKSAWGSLLCHGSDDSSNFVAWMIQPAPSTTTLAGLVLDQISEYDETNFVMVPQSSSGVPCTQVKLPRVDLPKLEGLSWEAYYGNSNYRGLVATNPSLGSQLVIGVGNAAGSTGKNMRITVELFFEAVWEGRKSLPQS